MNSTAPALISVKINDRVTREYPDAQAARDSIAWLENDAAYLDGAAVEARAKGKAAHADKVAANAEHSRSLARLILAVIAA